MALVLKDRVRVTSTTAGTGAFTLGSAVTGFQSFSVIGSGNTTYYTIADQSGANWEVGLGTYTAPNQLSRDTVYESSNANALVDFGAGTKDVFVSYPAEAVTNGTITNVTGTSPINSSGGSTPNISISQATTSTNGYLSSTDWNTFNNKQPAGSYLTSVVSDAPLTGSGTSGSHLSIPAATSTVNGYLTNTDWSTFNNKQAALVSGTNIKTVNGTTLLGSGDVGVGVTSVTGTAPISSSGGTTPAISISQATTSTNGYLSSTDWNTFNNKQPAGSYLTTVTADSPLTGSGTSASHLSIPAASTSTNGYLSSTDWNTFNNKQPAGSYLTSVTADSPLTGSGTFASHLSIPAASTTASGYLSSTDWNTFNNKGSGTVTNVTGTGTVSGISLSGSVSGSGNLTLGGSLNLSTPPAIGGTTPASGAFTTLSASSTVSGTGFSNYLASPPAIGGTTPNSITATSISGTSISGQSITCTTNPIAAQAGINVTSTANVFGNLNVQAGVFSTVAGQNITLNNTYTGGQTLIISDDNYFTGVRFTATGSYGAVFYSPVTLVENTGIEGVSLKASPTTTSYSFTLPDTAGSNNQVLQTDGSGNTSWMDLGSPPAIGGTTPNTITGTTVTANTDIQLPAVVNTGTTTGIIEMQDGGDGYDYLNLYTWDGGTLYPAKFPGGADITGSLFITGAYTGQYANLIGDGSTFSGYVQLRGYISGADVVLQAAASTGIFTLTLPTSAGSNNQVLKTDGSGNLDWIYPAGQGKAPRTITTATDTVGATDVFLIANRAGTVTLTLPAASSNSGKIITVKTIQAQTVVSATSNVVPLAGGAAGTAILAATAGKFAQLVSDGTNWITMQAN